MIDEITIIVVVRIKILRCVAVNIAREHCLTPGAKAFLSVQKISEI